MKIGIITMWDTADNYGQILQCYALQHYLRQKGHDAFLIKTVSDVCNHKPLKKRIVSLFRKIFNIRFWSLLVFRYKLTVFDKKYGTVDRGFEKFRSGFIVSTDQVYDINMLEENPPLCDAYITGSDQVWGAVSKVNFLTFVKKRLKYSYAASFGSNPFTREGCLQMREMLSSFDAITVREEKGVSKCKEWNIEASRVVDPTGLLTKEDYLKIAKEPSGNGYVLIYLLGNYTDVNVGKVYRFARCKGLEVKYIASQGRNDNYEKIFPSPTEWLGLIANAKYVFTNSYHCCMFCVYFERKFMFFKLKGIFKGMNDRFETLMKQYSIPHVKEIENIENIIFDYMLISEKVNEDRDKGKQILNIWFN